ncbi:class I SAM-dependent methyltransferase [Candidatus Peregrinibacteria bacterium]|nr:class I SAM-dependent methyltransferase [Candidatus Peregrinibacteria bacterium]
MEIKYTESSSRKEWTDPKIFDEFESFRGIVRDATKQVVTHVFQEHVLSGSRILELGSGVGELLKLIPPEHLPNIVGVEQSLGSLQRLKQVNPNAKVAVGSILRIPIADVSVDTVASFSVFDTIADLDEACKQTRRVLKANGVFVHFLDLQPHSSVLMEGFPPDVIAFPNVAKKAVPGIRQNTIDGYQLVKSKDYSGLRSSLHPYKRQLFDAYQKNPRDTFMSLYDTRKGILAVMAIDVMNSNLVDEIIPTFREAFNRKLAIALRNNGFIVDFQGDQSATTISPRTEQAKSQRNFNDFHNEVGALHTFWKPELCLSDDMIQVTSTLSVTIARKT